MRVACNVIRRGGSQSEIERGIRECSPNKRQDDLAQSEVANAAIAQLGANNQMLSSVATSLERMLAILGIISVIGKAVRLVPLLPARLFSIASLATNELVRGHLQRINVMRAANDNMIEAIRRAAANDALFRVRAGG